MKKKATKKAVPKKSTLRTRIAIVLDRSGSMQDMRREAIDAFNSQVEMVRKQA